MKFRVGDEVKIKALPLIVSDFHHRRGTVVDIAHGIRAEWIRILMSDGNHYRFSSKELELVNGLEQMLELLP